MFLSELIGSASLQWLNERHCVQEIVRPDVFWYEAALKSPMPFGNSPAAILGLVAFELFAMHYVEVRRAYDLKNPGSVDQDPIFKNYR